jgi:hypothetical protein
VVLRLPVSYLRMLAAATDEIVAEENASLKTET